MSLGLVHGERAIARRQSSEEREAVEASLAATTKAMARLSTAIAQSDDLPPLLTALQTYERQRVALEARPAELSNPQPTMDPAEVRKQLKGYLADWSGLLMGHVGQAQQVLRRLVVGRLTLTPKADGSYEFSGKGTIRPLLGGTTPRWWRPQGDNRLCTWRGRWPRNAAALFLHTSAPIVDSLTGVAAASSVAILACSAARAVCRVRPSQHAYRATTFW